MELGRGTTSARAHKHCLHTSTRTRVGLTGGRWMERGRERTGLRPLCMFDTLKSAKSQRPGRESALRRERRF
jgi:hypothetical protein